MNYNINKNLIDERQKIDRRWIEDGQKMDRR